MEENVEKFLEGIERDLPRLYLDEIVFSNEDEQRLAMINHKFYKSRNCYASNAISLLVAIRQYVSLKKINFSGNPSYHDLANLYYSLMTGNSTLANTRESKNYYSSAVSTLKNRKNPKILLLGFSTVYSLENLAALIHLSNLDNPKIIAFDINKQPLSEANVYCGTKLYNVEIEYEQGNAILSEFFEADSFDLIATHLFLTHIPDESKIRLINNVHKWLKPNSKFVDDEIIVPGTIDRNKYAKYYRTLGRHYIPPLDHSSMEKVANWMEKFGTYSIFFPYNDLDKLHRDFSKFSSLRSDHLRTRNIYSESDSLLRCPVYNITATKMRT